MIPFYCPVCRRTIEGVRAIVEHNKTTHDGRLRMKHGLASYVEKHYRHSNPPFDPTAAELQGWIQTILNEYETSWVPEWDLLELITLKTHSDHVGDVRVRHTGKSLKDWLREHPLVDKRQDADTGTRYYAIQLEPNLTPAPYSSYSAAPAPTPTPTPRSSSPSSSYTTALTSQFTDTHDDPHRHRSPPNDRLTVGSFTPVSSTSAPGISSPSSKKRPRTPIRGDTDIAKGLREVTSGESAGKVNRGSAASAPSSSEAPYSVAVIVPPEPTHPRPPDAASRSSPAFGSTQAQSISKPKHVANKKPKHVANSDPTSKKRTAERSPAVTAVSFPAGTKNFSSSHHRWAQDPSDPSLAEVDDDTIVDMDLDVKRPKNFETSQNISFAPHGVIPLNSNAPNQGELVDTLQRQVKGYQERNDMLDRLVSERDKLIMEKDAEIAMLKSQLLLQRQYAELLTGATGLAAI